MAYNMPIRLNEMSSSARRKMFVLAVRDRQAVFAKNTRSSGVVLGTRVRGHVTMLHPKYNNNHSINSLQSNYTRSC